MSTVRPEQFASGRPPRRIIGTEMEYYSDVINRLDMEPRYRYLAEMGIDDINGLGFLSNGALWYADVGHQEYASPESSGPFEATQTDHTGIRFMAGLALRALASQDLTPTELFLQSPQRRSGTYDIQTNIIHTKGYHENFQFPAEMLNRQALRSALATHLTTRQIFGGGGFQAGDEYWLAQKSYDIGAEVVIGYGNRTGRKMKPTASVLTGEDKTGEDWNILEVRFADPSMNPYQTYLDLSSTSLVLRLFEHEVITPENAEFYSIVEPVSAAQSISEHPLELAKRTYQMQSGEHLTAVDIQWRFAEAARDMIESGVRLPRDESLAVTEWQSTLNKLSCVTHDVDTLEPLFGRLDWATKCLIMHRKGFHEESDLKTRIAKKVGFDFMWSSVAPQGIGNRYATRRGYKYATFTDNAPDYLTTPPTTRAAARAALMQHPAIDTVSWNAAKTFDGQRLVLDDAYDRHAPEVPDIIDDFAEVD